MFISGNRYRLTIATPAKINLFLELRGKRADGYHEIESVMSKCSLFDYLVLSPIQDKCLRLSIWTAHYIDRRSIPSDESNLIVKTFRMMCDLAGQSSGMAIELFKRIPVQAGLGGASGNAAAVIVAVNRIWNLNWPRSRLLELGQQLGSDVPFFLEGNLARCSGRGERVQNLNYRCRLNLVIVKPAFGQSTAQIYSRCVVPDHPIETQAILGALETGQVSRIGKGLFNRLEQVATAGNQDTSRIRREFDRTPCAGHQLTGSGSCYFGIYPNKRSMLAAAAILTNRLPDMEVFVGHTLSPLSTSLPDSMVRS